MIISLYFWNKVLPKSRRKLTSSEEWATVSKHGSESRCFILMARVRKLRLWFHIITMLIYLEAHNFLKRSPAFPPLPQSHCAKINCCTVSYSSSPLGCSSPPVFAYLLPDSFPVGSLLVFFYTTFKAMLAQ